MSETQAPAPVDVAAPSKLRRVSSTAVKVGTVLVPTAMTVGATYVSLVVSKNHVAAANAALQTAKLYKA